MPQAEKLGRGSNAWYTTAAMAAVGGFAVGASGSEAQASIISWTTGATAPLNGGALFVNAQTGATTLSSFGANLVSYQFDLYPQYQSGQYDTDLQWDQASTGGLGLLGGQRPTPLAAGAPIGPTGNFGQANAASSQFNLFYKPGIYSPTNSNFGLSSTEYLGLRFGHGPSYEYGWVELSVDATGDMTVVAGGYQNTPNTAIAAGDTGPQTAIPEPASLLLLAGGMAGLAAFRARRTQRAAI